MAGQVSKGAGHGLSLDKSQSSEKTTADTYLCRGKLRTEDGGKTPIDFQTSSFWEGQGKKKQKTLIFSCGVLAFLLSVIARNQKCELPYEN